MKKIFTILILLAAMNSSAQWTAYYTGSGTQHWDCSFINSSTGWIGGDKLKVFKTTDGGNNWSLIYSPASSNIIYSIFFADSIHGWAGTYTGQIYRTTNGGYNWSSLTITNKKIFSLYFINQNTGWFAGESGVYGKTINGGESWFGPGALFAPADAKQIKFLDSLNGYACGEGKLAKTTDGGFVWNIMNFTDITLSSVSFVNSQTGYVLGSLQNNTLNASSLYILKTTNSGLNWMNIYAETPYTNNILLLEESHFHNENNGIFVGTSVIAGPAYSQSGVMRKTTNGGLNWSYIYLYWDNGLYTVKFANSLIGFAAGAGFVYKTTNGGMTFINNLSIFNPDKFSLSQNYPNPFNPTTNIKFQIAKSGNVKLIVFDILGKEVATLVNESLQPGTYETTFDGSNLTSGVYFYQMISGSYKETKKLLLLK